MMPDDPYAELKRHRATPEMMADLVAPVIENDGNF